MLFDIFLSVKDADVETGVIVVVVFVTDVIRFVVDVVVASGVAFTVVVTDVLKSSLIVSKSVVGNKVVEINETSVEARFPLLVFTKICVPDRPNDMSVVMLAVGDFPLLVDVVDTLAGSAVATIFSLTGIIPGIFGSNVLDVIDGDV